MSRFRLLGYLAAATFVLSAHAQPANDSPASSEKRIALAMQLLDLIGYRASWSESSKQCTKGMPSEARKAFTSSPGSFGGLSPQSAYWPDVERIYIKYEKTKCAAFGNEVFYRSFAEGYARELSDADLNAAIAFYSSDTGKRIQRATVEASVTLTREMARKMTQIDTEATAAFRLELRDLMSKYREDPK
jgi:hypothetical protein